MAIEQLTLNQQLEGLSPSGGIAVNKCKAMTEEAQTFFTAGQPTGYVDRQAFPCVFIHHGQQPNRPAITGSGMHHIITPDVTSTRWSQPHAAGTIIEPKPTTLGLFLGYF